ncbi:MAG TPA: Calx-beta domain-containing protein, partial [Thermoanaerobaculia bacterium]|nr:Calx-beta domain-containing protein [Thermoanaerobaculia bacterium]
MGVSIALAAVDPGRAALERTAFFGSESDGEATVVVERLGGTAGVLSVRVATAGLSASQGLDYAARDVVVTWADGDSQPKLVTVPIFDDFDIEPTELVEILLSSVPVGLGPSILLETGVIAIADADGPVACSPSARHLCLLGSRFRVEVEWRNQRNGQRGIGTAVPFADETGFFWFFDPDNIELATKALDGRAVTGAFWFFYGALSDVEYWITVTDTEAGSRQLYHNEPGGICGRGDTRAFPLQSQSPADGASTTARGAVGPATVLSLPVEGAIGSPVSRQACMANERTLCLLDGRFEVEVDWRNQRNGQEGVGSAIPFSNQTGLFWFFDSANIELVTKALDGRGVNGNFWFFFGALSDVEYTIRVRDTVTDQVQTYRNEPSNICGQGDTAAFPGGGGGPIAPPPPATSVRVGVVGCSQTTNAWRGWIDADPDQVWVVASGYGGGDIADWSRDIPNGDYWGRLDANIAANAPATAVWWQICDLAADNGTTQDAEAVLAEIQRRIPGAPVFVSSLADFETPETCVKQDIENSRFLVDHLTSLGLASRGPDLPMVMDSWIQPPEGDGRCHVGKTGR